MLARLAGVPPYRRRASSEVRQFCMRVCAGPSGNVLKLAGWCWSGGACDCFALQDAEINRAVVRKPVVDSLWLQAAWGLPAPHTVGATSTGATGNGCWNRCGAFIGSKTSADEASMSNCAELLPLWKLGCYCSRSLRHWEGTVIGTSMLMIIYAAFCLPFGRCRQEVVRSITTGTVTGRLSVSRIPRPLR